MHAITVVATFVTVFALVWLGAIVWAEARELDTDSYLDVLGELMEREET